MSRVTGRLFSVTQGRFVSAVYCADVTAGGGVCLQSIMAYFKTQLHCRSLTNTCTHWEHIRKQCVHSFRAG